ncbi:hypothetical protein A2331_01625 [Candidatus Falkowbacteria bacterium RIFOXYB2_FULL_34_18]|uniref:Undecaprenyl-phosphate alpha-N-acetylglucosaminyl 1-phosphate transferase n=1 Tax=Candidatus Falkowbacteria bacterium RIFOXYD2_FULL_34_120 TaxID=1798007 RepID=A0A1F5TPW1_9BACT|nr:MAG: hypothetical protein A2331_01625 [Candidatus Falkowbacteria bacterium RIFOXYB2_FULL_34_18]OGF29312.1 MAG: hypothetical protein A2500_05505 [Candidatus Falkowbacteria bacterium RIFOXYC12_FULL_34_55]OGF36428.1 MAG: hypothetical protein A2466_01165 [Candidatus Falkowbacteria bacterium RIFOXYC2_FULL_34_220]OGF38907.1 MAG: hypothetical protein A2515_05925 [Candidatus Falkowbacteria bacterium RIFOXYD12_FULL_34_57]OGF40926.1 MAG: hypothetical protein A2531_04150 [Candidatus Falkowbacteria bact
MWIYYVKIAIFTILATTLFVSLIRRLVLSFGILDFPDIERKKHQKGTPLLGGVGIFIAFFLMLFYIKNDILSGNLETSHWLGVFVGSCFLMIGGFLDDKFKLKAKWQIVWPVLAAFSVIVGGVNIEKVTNPFGGTIDFGVGDFSFISSIFIFLWLLGMMYTTKLLDGVDGLVTGVTAIGAFVIFLFTMTTKYYQADIGIASFVLFFCLLVFLIFNWYPAKIFLGEGGSLFLGFILGVLAVISGGKIAIALLVMGIPIMDVIWIMTTRIKNKQNPFTFSDRKHLHFRLIDLGFDQRKTVLFYYLSSTIFGLSALFLQSRGKFFAILLLIFIMMTIVISFNIFDKKNKNV